MPPKPILVKNENKKSTIFTPSRVVSRPDNLEGGEETEIAAQISVPQEGGYGWVVVAAAFLSIFILDGVAFTFGSLLNDMSVDLNMPISTLPIVNSIALSIYFMCGPLASALINRFGFRACAMSGMAYQPLLSFTVVKTTEDPTRTVTYLPNLSAAALKASSSRTKTEGIMPTTTERLFGAASNSNFPTAAAVVEDATATPSTQPGPSTATVSKITLTANAPQGGISPRQLKQVQSIMSKTSVQDKAKKTIELNVNVEKPKKTSCWGRLCQWEEHIPESRPMYRDDVFYDGKLEKLPAYQKSVMDTTTEKTGLEYQLAVSRAATAVDLRERRGVFTTAARRVLATMMDPKLLKRNSFLLLCLSGFFVYIGYLVPYNFLRIRNESAGMPAEHCTLFVSVIGFSNAAGRLILGALAIKVEPLKIFSFSLATAGLFITLGGLLIIPVKRMSSREEKENNKSQKPSITPKTIK
ncbi:unnamed protein product [Colias eurytheme]|nr:unnamed protein product [Colias eurytheme]